MHDKSYEWKFAFLVSEHQQLAIESNIGIHIFTNTIEQLMCTPAKIIITAAIYTKQNKKKK